MDNPSRYLDALIREFTRLPGIGTKSASRLAFHVLKMRSDDVRSLAGALVDLREHIVSCTICGGISDTGICSICADETRDRATLCVVESARDVLTLESTGIFTGFYHVLGGLISPLDGVGPDELNIQGLIERFNSANIREVILALNPTIEGDATSLYLVKILSSAGAEISRIAHGLPAGADLEYADSATIIRSLEGRVRMSI